MPLFPSYTARIALATTPCALLCLMLTCVMLTPGTATAQTAAWTAPSSGYVYDSIGRNILPVTGFIGSAAVGPSVASGIDRVSVAPNQKSALAVQNGSQIWIPDLSVPGTSQPLDRIPGIQQVFWAIDSSQAAVLAPGQELLWLNNFSSGPVPVSTWNLQSYGPSSARDAASAQIVRIGRSSEEAVWSLLAADSAANRVLLTVRTAGVWQIWLASSTVPPINIPFSGQPVAAAFNPSNGSIFVADAAGHQVVQIQNLNTNPIFTTLVSSSVYVNDPTAMVLSSDGNRLFLADHTDNVIRIFDVSGSAGGASGVPLAPMAELATAIAPVSLTAFAADRFVMNTGSIQPVFFLDTGVSPKLSFVPGGR
jgi:DNA-binding beta-propeller fold protein YncE